MKIASCLFAVALMSGSAAIAQEKTERATIKPVTPVVRPTVKKPTLGKPVVSTPQAQTPDTPRTLEHTQSGIAPADKLKLATPDLDPVSVDLAQVDAHLYAASTPGATPNYMRLHLTLSQAAAGNLQTRLTNGTAAQGYLESADFKASVASLIAALDAALNATDQLLHFKIQDAMDRYNQAQQLASDVQKRMNEAKKGIVQNIE